MANLSFVYDPDTGLARVEIADDDDNEMEILLDDQGLAELHRAIGKAVAGQDVSIEIDEA